MSVSSPKPGKIRDREAFYQARPTASVTESVGQLDVLTKGRWRWLAWLRIRILLAVLISGSRSYAYQLPMSSMPNPL